MLEKCRGIVLSTVNYSENSVVLKCYTDKYGLQSYMINGVKGKKAAIKPSHLMPLSLLEMEVYHQQNKNIQRIKELKCVPILNQLHFDLHKSTLALFMAELLGKSLREEAQLDVQMFGFVFNSIQIADLTEGSLRNFPVYFMVQLSKYLGFFPKTNYSAQTPDFSLNEGMFIANAPNTQDFCKGEMAFALNKFIQMNYEEIQHEIISAQVRRELLHKMIRYFQIHLMLFSDLKSPSILHEVLS